MGISKAGTVSAEDICDLTAQFWNTGIIDKDWSLDWVQKSMGGPQGMRISTATGQGPDSRGLCTP